MKLPFLQISQANLSVSISRLFSPGGVIYSARMRRA